MVDEVVIDVLREDIEAARAASNRPGYRVLEHCAVARAASRAIGEPVFTGGVLVRMVETETPIYKLPPEALSWINRFDAEKSVKPIQFTATKWENDGVDNSW